MPDLPSQPAGVRYESLDAWRGLACLMVVVYHAAVLYLPPPATVHSVADAVAWLGSFGDHGVPIFFVISGYCIAATIASEMRKKNGSIGRFYWRRLRRIYPPYWAMIAIKVMTLAILISAGMLPAEHLTALGPVHWISNLTLVSSFRWHLFGPERDYFLTQSWTLCYEQGFYFVCGLFLWLCFVTRKNVFFAAAMALSLIVVALQVLAPPEKIRGFFFDPHWLMFASGIVVYRAVQERTITRAVSIGGLLGYAVFGGSAYAASAGLFAALLILIHPFDVALLKSAWGRCLQFPGKACYSIYLTHTSVVVAILLLIRRTRFAAEPNSLLFVVPLCLGMSLVAGWIFYHLVEKRFVSPQRAKVAPAKKQTVSTANA